MKKVDTTMSFTLAGFSPQLVAVHEERTSNAQEMSG
jgi:hypothetical protein